MSDKTQPKLWQVAGTLAIAVMAVGGMFVMTRATSRPMVSLGPVVGYATVRDHDAVLVAYGRSGGTIGPPFGSNDTWQERVAAIALDDGELLWDIQLHDTEGWERGVLAVADGLAYVATDEGLSVLQVDDGSIVVGDLGDGYVESFNGYNVDPRIDAVVALTDSGQVDAVPLGTTDIAAVPEDIAEAWRTTLIAESSPTGDSDFGTNQVDPAAMPTGMALPGGQLITVPKPYQSPDQQLLRDGKPLARLDGLLRPELVYEVVRTPAALATPGQLEEGTAMFNHHHSAAGPLGAEHGVVLVDGEPADDPGAEELRLFDVETGDTLAVIGGIDGYVRATATPKGPILVIAAAEGTGLDNDRVIIVRTDGRTTMTHIGDTDFWGRTRANVTTL
ncbi:PA2928 family protein [Mycolicibacterium sp. HK-90]|uniref:PA2928 family protein n=1 Tax=Mycolicibacterium sp. HK-90 TaxID=3056937 RepID=UPI00265A7176|nr:PA2928 family protein [Mycolicibacterium sp. HK-90]WKG04525.1 PA2928 family protein [Mycolicibacterium sp. HK-90]